MKAFEINKENFEATKNSKGRVLIDFYADWCNPCRMMLPLVDQIARENPEYVVAKVNIDKEPELAERFNVATIPTFIVFEDGEIINRASGVKPKPHLVEMLES